MNFKNASGSIVSGIRYEQMHLTLLLFGPVPRHRLTLLVYDCGELNEVKPLLVGRSDNWLEPAHLLPQILWLHADF